MKAVVITRLMGGLGNQMFQYAAGRAIALRQGSPLLLDLGFFAKKDGIHTQRPFELDIFPIQAEKAAARDLRPFLCFERSGIGATLERELRRVQGHGYHTDRVQGYQPSTADARGRVLLNGYWQSEKYFLPAAETIRREFAFKQPLTSLDHDLAMRMGTANSISLHIRRGDYVSDPNASAFYANCGLEYYAAGISHIRGRKPEPELFIFSDDPEWVRRNMRFDHPTTFITHNTGDRSYMDMRLMSHCRHHIIANSSFSWWGAWLNADPQKIVVAPKQWFRDPRVSSKDLIPADWVQL